ncbi:MAG TPA: AgmX/PglI C-terminal domain-containing protein [Oligoflexus sp.]|uniref:AgmX/PglI C-terminal domain-containing protein n=1 Tax=Oligoflexus sp. TaxID=1971216 RepID=UPI002D58B2AB|nr:AgmX/PglI C-terminal domain-containing protein [Oligoflexus sp.]HYX37494.1 AgmX/PglI C-terminal domain-containing protein [Oligoflexus sp.]
MKFLFIILNVLVLTLSAQRGHAEDLYTALEAWGGELLPKDYGGFYVKMRLQGFKKNSRGLFITSNVFIHLHEVTQGKKYLVSQALGTDTTGQQKVWKIPAGNYVIHKLSLNDNSGLTRTWISKGKPQIFIKHLFLSNLGNLVLAPGQGKSLMVLFQPAANQFVNAFQHDAFAAVMDGYTQKVQKKLGGADLFAKSEDDFSSGDEARAAFSMQRQISMHYKVDLGAEQRYSKSIVNTLASQDLDLRTCYMDQLDRDGSLQGQLSFRFRVNSADGAMQNIKFSGGSLNSKKVVECLYFALGKMQFPIAKNLDGRVTFYFNFKDDMGRASP